MALVYRAIPILSTTLLRKKQIGERNISLEEYFYDLGFIDFENSAPFYRISEDSCSTFKYPEEETKAFFLFPFDAVSATLQSVNKKFYHHHEWKILEYDIPDDILTEYCGYGFYDGETKIEFRIPISEFKKWANPAHTIDINVLHKMITESVKKAIDEYKINEVDHKIADIISDELEEITKTCIDATREYFDCPFITNNNHLILKAFATAWKYRELYECEGNVDNIIRNLHTSSRQFYRCLDVAYMNPDKINEILSGKLKINVNDLFQIAQECCL